LELTLARDDFVLDAPAQCDREQRHWHGFHIAHTLFSR
jgi:hypothetical protein